MRLSFIVTSYNILPYIDTCLDSVATVVRPGDRVIVVDDGSDDGTAEQVEARCAAGLGEGVAVLPVLLGTNTIGGVGISGNIGLTEALADPACEGVFFVDGDDWLDPAGFTAARAAFAASQTEILLGNYCEYDEQDGLYRRPADAARWSPLPDPVSGVEAARTLALSMIAVPWRKFYRADFLRRHHLRFPEGNFFFEDNPFHWAVCLAAEHIGFHDSVLCQHRINRPGQTIASTGAELMAFFDHYETIGALVPDPDETWAGAVLDWLLNNMSWHMERLSPTVFWAYAGRAAEVLGRVPEAVWQATIRHFATNQIGGIAGALRQGDVAGVVGAWSQQAQTRILQSDLNQLHSDVLALMNEQVTVKELVGQIERRLQSEAEIIRFAALSALPLPVVPPLPDAPSLP